MGRPGDLDLNHRFSISYHRGHTPNNRDKHRRSHIEQFSSSFSKRQKTSIAYAIMLHPFRRNLFGVLTALLWSAHSSFGFSSNTRIRSLGFFVSPQQEERVHEVHEVHEQQVLLYKSPKCQRPLVASLAVCACPNDEEAENGQRQRRCLRQMQYTLARFQQFPRLIVQKCQHCLDGLFPRQQRQRRRIACRRYVLGLLLYVVTSFALLTGSGGSGGIGLVQSAQATTTSSMGLLSQAADLSELKTPTTRTTRTTTTTTPTVTSETPLLGFRQTTPPPPQTKPITPKATTTSPNRVTKILTASGTIFLLAGVGIMSVKSVLDEMDDGDNYEKSHMANLGLSSTPRSTVSKINIATSPDTINIRNDFRQIRHLMDQREEKLELAHSLLSQISDTVDQSRNDLQASVDVLGGNPSSSSSSSSPTLFSSTTTTDDMQDNGVYEYEHHIGHEQLSLPDEETSGMLVSQMTQMEQIASEWKQECDEFHQDLYETRNRIDDENIALPPPVEETEFGVWLNAMKTPNSDDNNYVEEKSHTIEDIAAARKNLNHVMLKGSRPKFFFAHLIKSRFYNTAQK